MGVCTEFDVIEKTTYNVDAGVLDVVSYNKPPPVLAVYWKHNVGVLQAAKSVEVTAPHWAEPRAATVNVTPLFV